MSNTRQPSMFLSGRAQKACQACQIAKVRCNAAAGSPCQNCSRKGIQCVVNRRIRQKRQLSTSKSTSSPSIKSDKSSPSCMWTSPRSPENPPLPSFSEEDFWNTFTNLGSSAPCTPSGFSHLALLPEFINPLPPTMSWVTAECLRVNGVLVLPSIRLQSALLQSFVENVLPSMPMIQWQQFLTIIWDGHGTHGSVSLLLYLAVMFSATTFVELEHLLEAGYASRKEAHEAFFQRTKLLYKANYESDPLTIVQSLLLMTFRLDTADGQDSRHWIKAAITVARSIGLFKDASMTMNFTSSTKSPKLWKRIAWACYMTDCVIALRLRCRAVIERAEFFHPLLTEEDFELYSLPLDNQILPPECTLIRNVKAQKDLANVCISTAKLCTCISNVLDLQGRQNNLNALSPNSPSASPHDDYTGRICSSEMELANWANTLPPPCQACPLEPHSIDEEPTVILQRNILHMIFYTTVAVFHQSQPFPSSKPCVQLAANQISRITSELYQRNLQHRLPVIGVTAILVALIIHVSEMKTPRSEERDEAIQNFQLCLAVMSSLRELYWEANTATAWALNVIQKVAFDTSSGYDYRFRERSFSSDSTLTDSFGTEVAYENLTEGSVI